MKSSWNDWNEEGIRIEIEDKKGWIIIDRPQTLNALDWDTMEALVRAIRRMQADPDVKVIVLTGSGDRAFVSGGDLVAEVKMTDFSAYRWSRLSQDAGRALADGPKPTIAAINGYALGGGLEIALACDFRICVEKAKLGVPETKVGVICGGGGTYRLTKLIGEAMAKELLMTSEMIDAQEACRLHLVNRIAPNDRLRETVDAFCEQLLNKGAITLEMTKRAVTHVGAMDYESAAELEAAMFGVIATTNDKVEGMSAFLEKRKPVFTDS